MTSLNEMLEGLPPKETQDVAEPVYDDANYPPEWNYDQCFVIGEILDQFMHLQEMKAVQEHGSRMDLTESKDARAKCLLSILNAGVV